MNIKRILLIAFFVVLPMVTFAAEEKVGLATYYRSIISTPQYQNLPQQSRNRLVMGMWDGLKAAQLVIPCNCDHFYWFKALVYKGFSTNQLEAIFSKYLEDHPERWHESPNNLFTEALYDAYEKLEE